MKLSRGWKVMLSGLFGGISLAIVQNKVTPILLLIANDLGISLKTAGLLSSVFVVVGIISALPAAFIVNKVGPKKVGIATLIISIGGSVLGLFADNIIVLLISRVIEGVGVSVIAVLTPSLISMWFPEDKRSLPIGIWTTWMTFSQTICFLMSEPLTNNFGWQGMWYLGIASCSIAVILFIAFVTTPEDEENYAPIQQIQSGDAINSLLKNKTIWRIGFIAFMFACISFTFNVSVSPLLQQNLNFSLGKASLLVAVLYFTEIFYSSSYGLLIGKIKDKRKLMIVTFLCLGIIGSLSFIIDTQYFILILCIFMVFDASNATILWDVAPMSASNSNEISLSVGVLNIGLNSGILIATPLAGYLLESFGYFSVGIAIVVFMIIGLLLIKNLSINIERVN